MAANKSQKELWTKASEHVKKRYQKWLVYWEPYHLKCADIYRMYLAKQGNTKDGKRARLRSSLPFSIIETVLAETHKALYDESPFLKFKPGGPEDEEDAKAQDEYIAYQMDKNHLKIKSIPFERHRLMFGLSWAYVPWQRELDWKRRDVPIMVPAMIPAPRGPDGLPMLDETGKPMEPRQAIDPRTNQPAMQPLMDPMTGKPVTKKGWKKEVVKDNWDLEPMLPWEVVSDPAIKSWDMVANRGEGIIFKRHYSDAELWKMQRDGIYQNVDEYFDLQEEDAESGGDGKGQAEDSNHDESLDSDLNLGHSYKKHLNPVHVYWGKFPARCEYDKNGKEILVYDPKAEPIECILDIAVNGSTCFRAIRNVIDEQIRPMMACNCHPQANHLASPGLLEIVEDELKEYIQFRNTRLDNLTQKMNPAYFVRTGAMTNVRDLRWKPFAIYRTPDPKNDFTEFPTPDLGQSYSSDMGQLQFDIQNTTNAISAAQGTSNMGQAFGRTAEGVRFFQNRMASRLGMVIDVGEVQFFGQLADITFCYNKQFLTKETDFAVVNRPNVYMKIRPEAFLQRRDFSPIGASRKLNKGQMIQILDRMLTELKGFSDFAKVDVILKEFVKLTDMFPNPDKILFTPEEMQQKMASKQPEVKRSMSMSIAFTDLPPAAQIAVLKELDPSIVQSMAQQMPMPQQPQPLDGMPAQMPPIQGMINGSQ